MTPDRCPSGSSWGHVIGSLGQSLCSGVHDELQRAIRSELQRLASGGFVANRLLDVGCWDGANAVRYAQVFGCSAAGIEIVASQADAARGRGVEVAELDLETDAFPWPDSSMDVVVMAEVLEHLKNVWLPISEIQRVLRTGGVAVFSTPNLASLHNRCLMLLGRQPTAIRTFGPHIRGFTRGEFKRFVTYGGAFTVERAFSVGFYPLPARFAVLPAALWKGAGHTTVIIARKQAAGDSPWTRYIRGELEQGLQTHYEGTRTSHPR
jgi:SAM-dependent methyltransferase